MHRNSRWAKEFANNSLRDLRLHGGARDAGWGGAKLIGRGFGARLQLGEGAGVEGLSKRGFFGRFIVARGCPKMGAIVSQLQGAVQKRLFENGAGLARSGNHGSTWAGWSS